MAGYSIIHVSKLFSFFYQGQGEALLDAKVDLAVARFPLMRHGTVSGISFSPSPPPLPLLPFLQLRPLTSGAAGSAVGCALGWCLDDLRLGPLSPPCRYRLASTQCRLGGGVGRPSDWPIGPSLQAGRQGREGDRPGRRAARALPPSCHWWRAGRPRKGAACRHCEAAMLGCRALRGCHRPHVRPSLRRGLVGRGGGAPHIGRPWP